MILAKCIKKNRDNKGNIKSYVLADMQGQKREYTGLDIKNLIKDGRMNVVNLQIDKAGRLVDKAQPKPTAKTPARPQWINKKDLDAVYYLIKCQEKEKEQPVEYKGYESCIKVYGKEIELNHDLGELGKGYVGTIEVLKAAFKSLGYDIWFYRWADMDEGKYFITRLGDKKKALWFRNEAIKYIADVEYEMNIENREEDDEVRLELEASAKKAGLSIEKYLMKKADMDLRNMWFKWSEDGFLDVCDRNGKALD